MKIIFCLLAGLLVPGAVHAQKKLGEAASIGSIEIKGDVVAGGRVTAVIRVRLEKGYHVHSNKPSEPQFIATELKLEPVHGVKIGTIDYPKAKSEKVDGLAKPLSVYEGEFELSVPVGLGAMARLPVTVPATLSYQACRGAQCYAPQKLKFDIVLPEKK